MIRFFSLILAFSILNNQDITIIRKLYPTAATSEIASKDFFSKLSGITNDDDKVMIAYKGASIVLMSKYIKKVEDKTKSFKDGIKLVEFAVKSEPDNIEIRLIRLGIQENVPKVVNYKKNINEDKNFLLAHYKKQSGDLQAYVKGFMLHSKSFSDSEKQTIK